MWQFIIDFLMKMGLGLLGVLFKSIADKAKQKGVDSSVLIYFSQLVDSADKNPSLKDNDAKWRWVWNEAVDYCNKNGMALATSFLETVLTAIVHDSHWGETADPNAVPSPLKKIA